MGLTFQIANTIDTGGRRATLKLPHGVVQTPVFMPVGTAATVKAVPQDTLERIGRSGAGAEIILANTYHLYLRPGHELIRRMGGVHRFMGWTRPMLTDSGGFQVFSLAKLRSISSEGVEFRSHLDGSKHFFSPEHSMAVQIALGADILMAFDECVETPATWQRTRDSMALTHAWAARSKAYWLAHRHEVPWEEQGPGSRVQGPESLSPTESNPASEPWPLAPGPSPAPSLFGIVQGGMYPDLRRESAERLVEMDFPGYAIGGLAVGEPRDVTHEMIAQALEILPKDKPRYVMGVGYPDEIEEYARMGVDMMDCVLPTRAARHGLLFRSAEAGESECGSAVRMNIKRLEFAEDQRPIDPACGCMVCQRYTRAYLRHLFVAREPLGATLNSIHNLSFYLDTMERVRDSMSSTVRAIGRPITLK